MNRIQSSVVDDFDGYYDLDLSFSTSELIDSALEPAEYATDFNDDGFDLDDWGGTDDIDLDGLDIDD